MSSTLLTNKSPAGKSRTAPKTGAPLENSRSLKIALHMRGVQKGLERYLTRALAERGYGDVSPALLGFLSELECGVNHAADIARRLGVSRQRVSKTVGQLAGMDLLALEADAERANRKVITFTARGERLMSEARAILAALDRTLASDMPEKRLQRLEADLAALENHLAGTPSE